MPVVRDPEGVVPRLAEAVPDVREQEQRLVEEHLLGCGPADIMFVRVLSLIADVPLEADGPSQSDHRSYMADIYALDQGQGSTTPPPASAVPAPAPPVVRRRLSLRRPSMQAAIAPAGAEPPVEDCHPPSACASMIGRATQGVAMPWRDRIVADPAVLGGKPVVRGTRLAVALILDLLAAGWSEARLLEEYPQLTGEDIRACLAFAAESVREERI